MSDLRAPSALAGAPTSTMHRRSLLKAIGVGGLLAGTGSAGLGIGLGDVLGVASPAGASTTCPSGSRIADLRIFGGTMNATLGVGQIDMLTSTNGGATFGNTQPPKLSTSFVPYCSGANGVQGAVGVGGDHGWVMIYDPATSTWRKAQPGGGSPIITALAGNGPFWVAVSTEGKFWYTTNNGATWSSPANGAYLNYKSIASILTVYDLEYANGVWIGCGYDTLGVGRTFWRSTAANPTRGAKNSWFSVSGGDFAEVTGTGDGNAVSVYAVTYGGNCQANPNTWYGAGNFGTVWRSTDNGASWQAWRDSGSHIHFGIGVNPNTGKVLCASGLGGIYEVNPGMVQRYSPGAKEIYEIAWAGANDWVAAGDNGQVLVSHDDGITWAQAAMPAGTGAALYNCIAKVWP